MKKATRVATICHNEDDYRDHEARRVRLELHPEPGPLAILAGAAFGLFALWACTVFLFSL